MTLDDTYRELRRFKADLARFNDTLAGAVKALETEHSQLTGLWNDRFRREYDSRWATFETHMKRYLTQEAGSYSAFVDQKISQLGRYLDGN